MTLAGERGVLHELAHGAGRWLIRGGRVLDPVQGRDGPADVLLEDGVVVAVDAALHAPDAEVLDASGCWVARSQSIRARCTSWRSRVTSPHRTKSVAMTS